MTRKQFLAAFFAAPLAALGLKPKPRPSRNSLVSLDVFTREWLAVYEKNLQAARQVNREYAPFITAPAWVGETIHIRKPPRYNSRFEAIYGRS